MFVFLACINEVTISDHLSGLGEWLSTGGLLERGLQTALDIAYRNGQRGSVTVDLRKINLINYHEGQINVYVFTQFQIKTVRSQ